MQLKEFAAKVHQADRLLTPSMGTIHVLTDLLVAQDAIIVSLEDQLAEQNLRVRFIMDHFHVQRPTSALVTESGQRPVQRMTLYELYVSKRDEFLDRILKEALGESDGDPRSAVHPVAVTEGTGTGANLPASIGATIPLSPPPPYPRLAGK